MKSNLSFRIVVLAVCIPTALAGCSLFRAHSDWDKAASTRPLEIPPDLDTPPSTGALVVPDATGSTGQAPVGMPPGSAGDAAAVGVDGLHVEDSVDGTWQRVGLALERAGVGTVEARDQAAHTYSVAVNSTRTTEKRGGWFKRLFSRAKTETVRGQVNVGVTEDGSGSRVSVSGERSAVEKVIAVLRDRLG